MFLWLNKKKYETVPSLFDRYKCNSDLSSYEKSSVTFIPQTISEYTLEYDKEKDLTSFTNKRDTGTIDCPTRQKVLQTKKSLHLRENKKLGEN